MTSVHACDSTILILKLTNRMYYIVGENQRSEDRLKDIRTVRVICTCIAGP